MIGKFLRRNVFTSRPTPQYDDIGQPPPAAASSRVIDWYLPTTLVLNAFYARREYKPMEISAGEYRGVQYLKLYRFEPFGELIDRVRIDGVSHLQTLTLVKECGLIIVSRDAVYAVRDLGLVLSPEEALVNIIAGMPSHQVEALSLT